MEYRIERDSMGEIRVPADRLWGAQTQRSYENFRIGSRLMPDGIIKAFALQKQAAALANLSLGKLDETRAELISRVCDEILEGIHDGEFPLSVFQTGSGTQTNMNLNEVIANRGNALAGSTLLHPNDSVNMSQSSNDTFPTAMNIAGCLAVSGRLIPAIRGLSENFLHLEREYATVIKVGRTHLQDAVPLTLGQEISGWRSMLDASERMIASSLSELKKLAIGATAVGTGLNAPAGFDAEVCRLLSEKTGMQFLPCENKFYALTSKDAFVFAHGAIKALACDLFKIANDIRILSCGPRCGIGELTIPANEPGSSIMPGKVNPTQCEAMTMVCAQVMGNDLAISVAASGGQLELNVFMPVLADNFLSSCGLLADALDSFGAHCAAGIRPNTEKINEYLGKTLMLVTALSPEIGYDNAAKAAANAHTKGLSLRDSVLELGLMTGEKFDELCRPERMV